MRLHDLLRYGLWVMLFWVGGLLPMNSHATERVVVGYYPEWAVYDRRYEINDIPAAQLTHLCYAFAKIVDGELAIVDRYAAIERLPAKKGDIAAVRGNFAQLQWLKKQHPHLKTLISVGGWTLSSPFSDVASTPTNRAKFIKSCVQFVKDHSFDGIDIDWEYPVQGGLAGNKTRPEDKANLVLLLAELRQQLKMHEAKDHPYLLTIATPAGLNNLKNFDLPKLAASVDWFNVMAYDLAGGWDQQTGLLANVYATAETKPSVDAVITAYLAAGVPARQLVLGVPLYGRGWGGVPNGQNGLGQVAKGPAPKGTWEVAMWDYRDIVANYLPKMTRYRHGRDQSPWLYDAKTGLFISYEDEASLRFKGEYLRKKQLRGLMCWELSGDDRNQPLLNIIADEAKKRD